jgi:hypothetical protein
VHEAHRMITANRRFLSHADQAQASVYDPSDADVFPISVLFPPNRTVLQQAAQARHRGNLSGTGGAADSVEQEEQLSSKHFLKGDHVEIYGLQAAAQFNGRVGAVTNFEAVKGRYTVQLEWQESFVSGQNSYVTSTEKPIRVQPANLKQSGGGAETRRRRASALGTGGHSGGDNSSNPHEQEAAAAAKNSEANRKKRAESKKPEMVARAQPSDQPVSEKKVALLIELLIELDGKTREEAQRHVTRQSAEEFSAEARRVLEERRQRMALVQLLMGFGMPPQAAMEQVSQISSADVQRELEGSGMERPGPWAERDPNDPFDLLVPDDESEDDDEIPAFMTTMTAFTPEVARDQYMVMRTFMSKDEIAAAFLEDDDGSSDDGSSIDGDDYDDDL